MAIHIWGTDFRRSAPTLRSQLFIPLEEREQTVREILALGFQDLVYLHTCNRVEFYTTAKDHFADTHQLWNRLFTYFGLPIENFYQGFHLEGKSSVRHLTRVASSLESMVIGEPQILGQLKDALAWTQKAGLPVSRTMHRTFQFAFETAKKVRSDTSIGQNPVSVVSLGIERLERLATEVPLTQVALVGTSPICSLVRTWLAKNHPTCPIIWANRTLARLENLPEAKGTQCVTLSEFVENPPPFSHLFSATSAPHIIFGKSFFEKLGDLPRVLFDFAQPADIERPEAIPAGLHLIGLENLAYEARENETRRKVAVDEAIAVIEQGLREFYLQQKEAPLLRDFSEVAPQFEESLKQAVDELQRWVNLDQGQVPNLNKWARSLVQKNLHQSREHLRTILRRAAQTSPEMSPPL